MSILSWNCGGLGHSQDLTIQRLMEIRKKYFPEVLFLMETMHGINTLVDIQVWLSYNRVYTVDPIRRSGGGGGLAVFWKDMVDIEVLSADKNLVDIGVQLGEKRFYVSCIYGEPNESKRKWFWEKVSRIGLIRRGPWCMVGDFNAICGNHEKSGGPARSDSVFENFNDMLKVCRMKEPVSQGDPFIWGGRRGDHRIRCKLDRCFGNKEWFNFFPRVNQRFLEKRGSDHRPVLVTLQKKQEGSKGRFRFDKNLFVLPQLKEKVIESWSDQGGILNPSVSARIKRCRNEICNWKNSFEMNAKAKILRIQDKLEVEESGMSSSRDRISSLKLELMRANREEESFWKQQSKDKWLKCGDRNTKAFHASVQMTRR